MKIFKLALLVALLAVVFLSSGNGFKEKTTSAQECPYYYYELYDPSADCYVEDRIIDIYVGFRGNWPDGSTLTRRAYSDNGDTINQTDTHVPGFTFDTLSSVFTSLYDLGSDNTFTQMTSLKIGGKTIWSSTVTYDCSGGDGPAVINNQVTNNNSCGEPPEEEEVVVPVPGCDVFVKLPSTAVVGALTDNAAVYWKPGNQAEPIIVLDAGKTYWVDGLDSTGMYRKILMTCTWRWVEASKVGPNFDNVWHGTPLPTHTVK